MRIKYPKIYGSIKPHKKYLKVNLLTFVRVSKEWDKKGKKVYSLDIQKKQKDIVYATTASVLRSIIE